MLPLRHIHKKKINNSGKKYKYSIIDHLIYLVAFAGPVMTIPQVMDVWSTSAATVNEVTWTGYLAISIIWLLYGIKHKVKPIIFSNLLGLVTNGLIVVGLLI